jgi:hypothetical protein
MSKFQGSAASNMILLWGTMIVGIIMALLIGRMVAVQNFQHLGLIFGSGIGLAIALILGRYFWVLIPAMSAFTGSISILPLPFSYAELATIGVIGLFLMHLAFKKVTISLNFTLLDWILLLNIVWICIAYIRNPIGFRATGSDTIGGRDYFYVAIAYAGYFVLSNVQMGPKLGYYFPILKGVPVLIAGAIMIVTEIFPALGRVIYPFYSGVSIAGFSSAVAAGEEASRLLGFQNFSRTLTLLLCCYFIPVTLLLPTHPVRFFLLIFSTVGALLSGFRTLILYSAGVMLLATALRRRWSDMVFLLTAGFLFISLVIILQSSGIQMPYTAQRALSFVPFVEWDQRAVAAAQDSTQWRFEMWEDAMSDSSIIKDKVLGDGFGFTIEDFRAIMDTTLGQGPGFIGGSRQEGHLATGSFHSGPISTIRVVGLVGLVLLVAVMLVAAIETTRYVKKTYGSPFFPTSLFLAIPAIYIPFAFLFIFGAYRQNIIAVIYSIGYLNLLISSFNAWKMEQTRVASAD